MIRAANVVPRIVICAAAATVVAGLLIRHLHGGLGTATPPFVMVWGPRLHPLALVSVAAVVLAVVLAPRLVGATDRPASFAARVLALALVLGLALNLARTGMRGWDAIFDPRPGGSFEASNEYLPGLPALSYGRASTSTASPSSSRRCRSTSPATPGAAARAACLRPHDRRPRCRAVHRLRRADRAADYALGRSLGTDRDARVAAVLAACSPAMLLFGVTSFDAVFAACGLAAAALLAAQRRAVRAAGAVALGAASLLSWALLAVGAWATVLAWRRRGPLAAVGLAAACAAAA